MIKNPLVILPIFASCLNPILPSHTTVCHFKQTSFDGIMHKVIHGPSAWTLEIYWMSCPRIQFPSQIIKPGNSCLKLIHTWFQTVHLPLYTGSSSAQLSGTPWGFPVIRDHHDWANSLQLIWAQSLLLSLKERQFHSAVCLWGFKWTSCQVGKWTQTLLCSHDNRAVSEPAIPFPSMSHYFPSSPLISFHDKMCSYLLYA